MEAVHAKQLQLLIEAASRTGLLTGSATIRLQAVQQLDTYGAWLLERFVRTWRARGIDMRIFQLPARHDGLLAEVRTTNREGGRADCSALGTRVACGVPHATRHPLAGTRVIARCSCAGSAPRLAHHQ